MNRIFMLADIHGDWRHIRDLNIRLIKKLDETDIIILLGDTGVNYFFNERDERLKKDLGKFKCTYFLIRGNHESRVSPLALGSEKWETQIFFDGPVWVEKEYPYIKYAKDHPMRYIINGYNTLVIPGAYSVDKNFRLKMGYSWFENEQLTEEEMQLGRDLITYFDDKIDIVLSHTCPLVYEPTDLFLSSVDQSTVDKTMERYLGEIEYNLDYKLFCWGHFHQYRVYPQYKGRQPLMLYNDKAIELNEWMAALPDNIGKTY